MLDGVNDSPAQARALARLLKGHPAKVNLIPFNPFPGTQYRRSRPEAIRAFLDQILKGGVMATIRRTRGDDIDAAWHDGARNVLAVLPTGAGKTATFAHKLSVHKGAAIAIARPTIDFGEAAASPSRTAVGR